MSYYIEYQAACFAIPAGLRGVTQTRFAIVVEGGSNNCTVRAPSGVQRRARDWSLAMLGTHTQVLRQAVAAAADCEGMGLRIRGRTTTPEAYIRRVRCLLDRSRDDVNRHFSLHATVPAGHALIDRARCFGMTERQHRRWGQDESTLAPPLAEEGPDWGVFFRAIEPFLEDDSVPLHRLGQVWGLPAS